jgi:hypothetical protein
MPLLDPETLTPEEQFILARAANARRIAGGQVLGPMLASPQQARLGGWTPSEIQYPPEMVAQAKQDVANRLESIRGGMQATDTVGPSRQTGLIPGNQPGPGQMTTVTYPQPASTQPNPQWGVRSTPFEYMGRAEDLTEDDLAAMQASGKPIRYTPSGGVGLGTTDYLSPLTGERIQDNPAYGSAIAQNRLALEDPRIARVAFTADRGQVTEPVRPTPLPADAQTRRLMLAEGRAGRDPAEFSSDKPSARERSALAYAQELAERKARARMRGMERGAVREARRGNVGPMMDMVGRNGGEIGPQLLPVGLARSPQEAALINQHNNSVMNFRLGRDQLALEQNRFAAGQREFDPDVMRYKSAEALALAAAAQGQAPPSWAMDILRGAGGMGGGRPGLTDQAKEAARAGDANVLANELRAQVMSGELSEKDANTLLSAYTSDPTVSLASPEGEGMSHGYKELARSLGLLSRPPGMKKPSMVSSALKSLATGLGPLGSYFAGKIPIDIAPGLGQ